MKINNLVRKSISEAMGVMIFVTSIVAANFNPTFHNLALASTLAVMILLTAGVSGGHLNPAVSFFFFARKEINLSTLVSYWIAQLSGAALGLYLGFALSGSAVEAITAPAGISANAVFIGELFSTTVLVVIIHRLASTKRAQLIPVAVGLWVLAASTFTVTGAQANPAVTFALMLRDGFSQGNLGIVLAEFAGALLALLYILLLDEKIKKSKKKK
ncbi:MAG: aquaporin [Rhodoluna sp.]|jgi:arsenate reductase|nr:aquaporin [Rhodoluna sp.]